MKIGTNLNLKTELVLAQALGRKDHAQAIEILRAQPFLDAGHLALVAQCHWWLGDELKCIEVAHEAISADANCFDAHRILASLYAQRRDHGVGLLHTQQAIRSHRPTPRVPVWLNKLSAFLVLLRRGQTAAAVLRSQHRASEDNESKWLQWGQDYIRWNKKRGTLVAANQPFPSAPRAEP